MSQNNCDCGNVTMLPVKGFELAVDTSALPGCDPIEAGPNGTVLTSQDGELVWEEPAAAGPVGVYSAEEHWTGMIWIDGKKIYRQVVELGALPNNALKNVSFSIAGLQDVVNLWGQAKSSNAFFTFPYGSPSSIASVAMVYDFLAKQFVINTGKDLRVYATTRAIIEYTCTDR